MFVTVTNKNSLPEAILCPISRLERNEKKGNEEERIHQYNDDDGGDDAR